MLQLHLFAIGLFVVFLLTRLFPALDEPIVFGAFDEKAGAVGSLWDVVRDRRLPHRPEVVSGVLSDECGAILSEFFKAQR